MVLNGSVRGCVHGAGLSPPLFLVLVHQNLSTTQYLIWNSHECLSPAPSVASLRPWQAWKMLQSITFDLWEPGYRPIAGFSMASHVRSTRDAELSYATPTTARAISRTSLLSMLQRKPSSVARTMACAKCGSTVEGIESCMNDEICCVLTLKGVDKSKYQSHPCHVYSQDILVHVCQ